MGKIERGYFLEDDPGKVEKLGLIGAGVEDGGVQKLPLIEAAYFEGKGFLSTGKSVEELIGLALEADALAKERFAVLKELRDSGYIVRWGVGESEFLRVYQKGIRMGEDRTETVVKVLREGENPSILGDIAAASGMRKDLVYAFVGEKIVFVKAYRVSFD